MPGNFRAELVACLGQPVDENPTGAMQEAAFQALGLNWRYLTACIAYRCCFRRKIVVENI